MAQSDNSCNSADLWAYNYDSVGSDGACWASNAYHASRICWQLANSTDSTAKLANFPLYLGNWAGEVKMFWPGDTWGDFAVRLMPYPPDNAEFFQPNTPCFSVAAGDAGFIPFDSLEMWR